MVQEICTYNDGKSTVRLEESFKELLQSMVLIDAHNKQKLNLGEICL